MAIGEGLPHHEGIQSTHSCVKESVKRKQEKGVSRRDAMAGGVVVMWWWFFVLLFALLTSENYGVQIFHFQCAAPAKIVGPLVDT